MQAHRIHHVPICLVGRSAGYLLVYVHQQLPHTIVHRTHHRVHRMYRIPDVFKYLGDTLRDTPWRIIYGKPRRPTGYIMRAFIPWKVHEERATGYPIKSVLHGIHHAVWHGMQLWDIFFCQSFQGIPHRAPCITPWDLPWHPTLDHSIEYNHGLSHEIHHEIHDTMRLFSGRAMSPNSPMGCSMGFSVVYTVAHFPPAVYRMENSASYRRGLHPFSKPRLGNSGELFRASLIIGLHLSSLAQHTVINNIMAVYIAKP